MTTPAISKRSKPKQERAQATYERLLDVAGALLEQFGEDFSFVPLGVAIGHHGLGYLRWQAGPKDGPVVVTGVDVATVIDGKITQLWVLLDPPA